MGSRITILVVAGILILGVVVGARMMLTEQPPEPVETPPEQAAPPPPADLAPEAARRLFAKRSSVAALEGGDGIGDSPYVSVRAQFDQQADPSPVFLEIFDVAVDTAVLTATVRLDDGRALPPAPLLILTRAKQKTMAGQPPAAPVFRDVFSADGNKLPITPLFRRDGASKITVSLAVSYFQNTDMVFEGGLIGEAESLLATYESEPPFLWTRENGQKKPIRAFATRLEGNRAKVVEDLLTVDIPLDDGTGPGRRIRLADKTGTSLGEITLQLNGHPPFLAERATDDLGYPDLAAVPLYGSERLGSVFDRHAGLVAAIIAGNPASLNEACSGLSRAIEGEAGLASVDTTAVLRSLTRDHALFAGDTDYGEACLGGSEVPEPKTDAASPRPGHMNEVLKIIGATLRYGAEQNGERLAAHAAARAVLVDRTGLWLGGADGVLAGDGSIVHPDAIPDQVAELVGALPAAHFACFSKGEGSRGGHRAALVQLRHDSGLMVLDAAFGGDGRLIGLSLSPAGRAEVCRAVGKRKSGENACYFARTGLTYNGIDPGKC